MIILLVTFILLIQTDTNNSQSYYHNGKLTSGLFHNGFKYEHILVEAGKVKAKSFVGGIGGRGCYRRFRSGYRLSATSITRQATVDDKRKCENICTQNSACTAFNYSPNERGTNCEISTLELRSSDLDDAYIFEQHPSWEVYQKERDCNGGLGTGFRQDRYGLRDDFRFNSQLDRFGNNQLDRFGNNQLDRFGNNQLNRFGSNRFDRFGSGGIQNQFNRHNQFGNNYDSPFISNNFNLNSQTNRDCFEMSRTNSILSTGAVRERIGLRSLGACKQACLKSRTFHCMSLSFSNRNLQNSASSWFGGRESPNCYLSDRSAATFVHSDLSSDRDFDTYVRDRLQRSCQSYGGLSSLSSLNPFGLQQFGGFPYGREGGYETVSGIQCYQHPCRMDRAAGYYFCETDGGGSWDYCCNPESVCQRQRGQRSASCYVGSQSRDQWRPCTQNNNYRGFLEEAKVERNETMQNGKSAKTPENIPGIIPAKLIEKIPEKTQTPDELTSSEERRIGTELNIIRKTRVSK